MAKYYTEPIDQYYCIYCETEFKVKGFSTHIKRKHGIKFHDYVKENLELFKNVYKICEICNENITTGHRCSKKCDSIWKKEYFKNRNIWNEMDDVTKILVKEKMSKYAKEVGMGVNIWDRMDDDTKFKAKKKISEKTSQRCKGSGNPMFGKKHSHETIQKIMKYRPANKLETKFKHFLDSCGIEYYFQYFISNDSVHSYDFKIKGKNLIIELDGDYWHGGPGSKTFHKNIEQTKITDKLKTEIALSRGIKVIRIWESVIERDFKSVQNMILAEIESL